MSFELYIYLSGIALGIIMSVILLSGLRKASLTLPEAWKKSLSERNFCLAIWFLMIYLSLNLIFEIISMYLAAHAVYNGFMYNIGVTICTPFFFSFLFIHTKTIWKRYTYFILYTILIGYFISSGCYHPKYILSLNSSLVICSIYFSAALLHLTDLLVNKKSDHFKFQLRINLNFLIFMLLASIVTSYYWSKIEVLDHSTEFIYYIQFIITIIFYYTLDFILLIEILKRSHHKSLLK